MQRHQWAAERMWQALITPSEEAWIKGTEAMADAPLAPEQLAPERSTPAEIKSLSRRVHSLAEDARGSRDINVWVARYGEMLTTCAECHRALGRQTFVK